MRPKGLRPVLGPIIAGALVLAGCAAAPSRQGPSGPSLLPTGSDSHIPPFARVPYEGFSRDAAVQIAYREWRSFGQPIVFPHTPLPYDREREEGLWQRVGEYWWLGLPMGAPDSGFTGKHDDNGRVFPASEDGNYAWSAAFVSYVMRMAGAGPRFPYAANHSDYINVAREHGLGSQPNVAVTAERPEDYAPRAGDLICMWRGRRQVTYDELPTGRFPGHCDIVVALHPGTIDVIGGNVENAVSLKHIPVAADGKLADAPGHIVDPDYPWFVVLRVGYERDGALTASLR